MYFCQISFLFPKSTLENRISLSLYVCMSVYIATKGKKNVHTDYTDEKYIFKQCASVCLSLLDFFFLLVSVSEIFTGGHGSGPPKMRLHTFQKINFLSLCYILYIRFLRCVWCAMCVHTSSTLIQYTNVCQRK